MRTIWRSLPPRRNQKALDHFQQVASQSTKGSFELPRELLLSTANARLRLLFQRPSLAITLLLAREWERHHAGALPDRPVWPSHDHGHFSTAEIVGAPALLATQANRSKQEQRDLDRIRLLGHVLEGDALVQKRRFVNKHQRAKDRLEELNLLDVQASEATSSGGQGTFTIPDSYFTNGWCWALTPPANHLLLLCLTEWRGFIWWPKRNGSPIRGMSFPRSARRDQLGLTGNYRAARRELQAHNLISADASRNEVEPIDHVPFDFGQVKHFWFTPQWLDKRPVHTVAMHHLFPSTADIDEAST